jgi:hypothetical protein
MNTSIFSACALLTLGASLGLAQAPQGKQPPPPMSFFITSSGTGKGGDLGGLAGADNRCQTLAAAAGSTFTWHAYLSTQAKGGQPAVNARDRIGDGPWYGAKGNRIAMGLSDLHGDTLDQARVGNALTKASAFTEKGEPVKGAGDTPNQHDMLTGSTPDGRAFTDAADHTCNNWTSSNEGNAMLGHFDRTGGPNVSWNAAHPSAGCSQDALVRTGGAGLFYCFAIDSNKR